MIPTVKAWRMTLIETGERIVVHAPTKALALIVFRSDYPQHLGKPVRVGLLRGTR